MTESERRRYLDLLLAFWSGAAMTPADREELTKLHAMNVDRVGKITTGVNNE
jgi:hypothetical protein